MGTEQLTVAVIGAGGKMGMRVSANLDRSQHNVLFSETSPPAKNACAPRAGKSPNPKMQLDKATL
jgi:D-apionate oxidoisomerase